MNKIGADKFDGVPRTIDNRPHILFIVHKNKTPHNERSYPLAAGVLLPYKSVPSESRITAYA
ncbi:hypothetical protein PMJ10TS2_24410 [Paenibacillus melissococcoides]